MGPGAARISLWEVQPITWRSLPISGVAMGGVYLHVVVGSRRSNQPLVEEYADFQGIALAICSQEPSIIHSWNILSIWRLGWS